MHLNIAKRIRKFLEKRRVRRLCSHMPYLEAYTAHTDIRVEQDPYAAVGGIWDELGTPQINYLKQHDLEPHHTLLAEVTTRLPPSILAFCCDIQASPDIPNTLVTGEQEHTAHVRS